MHEKEIEKLQAEKEKVERQLAQEQHKIQQLENRAAYYEKGESGRTGLSPVVLPLRALLRRRKSWAKPSFTLLPNRSLRCRTHKDCSRKPSAITQEVTEYRVISFSCNADQAQRGAVCRSCCRLSCRGKAAQ